MDSIEIIDTYETIDVPYNVISLNEKKIKFDGCYELKSILDSNKLTYTIKYEIFF